MLSATIGGFDGVHLAHQELISRADIVIVIEKGSSLTPGFDRFFYINRPIEFLTLHSIKDMEATQFIDYLKSLNISKIVVGDDFKFGKNRNGSIDLLKKSFLVDVINEIKLNSIAIHSRVIRELILKNEIKMANMLLGRNYKIRGYQIKGQGIGKKELLPTINIDLLKPYILPKGVFITKTNGYNSLTFIGKRSTDNNFSIETHLLEDFKIDKLIEIEFLQFLRPTLKFHTLNELKAAINADLQNAKSYFLTNSKKFS